MAGETGPSSFDLTRELCDNGAAYEFFQAVRLLSRVDRAAAPSARLDKLRIRPVLSLDYPGADIDAITPRTGGGYDITTTFMGLYGVSSPMPAFVTEDLLDEEWDDESASRDFLDIIHYHLYPLLYGAWLKYRFAQNAVERGDDSYWDLALSLFGLGTPEVRQGVDDVYALIPYIGLFTQQPKSLAGLTVLLKNLLAAEQLDIEPCVLRAVKIPADQRLCLGVSHCTVGNNAVIGERAEDRTGKIVIRIGGLNAETLQRFINDNGTLARMRWLIGFYLNQPLEYDIVLSVPAEALHPAVLGERRWGSLGRDTWLAGRGDQDVVEITLPG